MFRVVRVNVSTTSTHVYEYYSILQGQFSNKITGKPRTSKNIKI